LSSKKNIAVKKITSALILRCPHEYTNERPKMFALVNSKKRSDCLATKALVFKKKKSIALKKSLPYKFCVVHTIKRMNEQKCLCLPMAKKKKKKIRLLGHKGPCLQKKYIAVKKSLHTDFALSTLQRDCMANLTLSTLQRDGMAN